MRYPSVCQWDVKSLFALTFIFLTAAQITQQKFATSFRLYQSGVGGCCERNAPNGIAMNQYIRQCIGDAYEMASTTAQEMQSYFTYRGGNRARGLLYPLFGVEFIGIEFDPETDAQTTYNYIKDVFDKIGKLDAASRASLIEGALPWFRCLEDYAKYMVHLPDDDGKEDLTAPLAAVEYHQKLPNGDYYPGLMFVFDDDRQSSWCLPEQTNPGPGGGCAPLNEDVRHLAFTIGGKVPKLLSGITVYPAAFDQATTKSLGDPAEEGGVPLITRYLESTGASILHEIYHLVTHNGTTPLFSRPLCANRGQYSPRPDIVDEQAAFPPDRVDFENRDWANLGTSWRIRGIRIRASYVSEPVETGGGAEECG